MSPPTHKEVFDAWIEYHSKEPSSQSLFWAWEYINETVSSDPESGWQLILGLIQQCPNNWVLCNIAAGPLEDLLIGNPERFIDRIETQVRRDPKFRLCLTGVWYEKEISEEICQRIDKYTLTVEEPL